MSQRRSQSRTSTLSAAGGVDACIASVRIGRVDTQMSPFFGTWRRFVADLSRAAVDSPLAKLYFAMRDAHWVETEIKPEKDREEMLARLSPPLQRVVKLILAYFATADGIVFENLKVNFAEEFPDFWARAALGMQASQELVHQLTYMRVMLALVPDEAECEALVGLLGEEGAIRGKAEWAATYMDPDKRPLAVRVMAFGLIEAIFFQPSFAYFFWIAAQSPAMMAGLTTSNKFIRNDEGMHVRVSAALYRQFCTRLADEEAHALVRSAMDAERAFVDFLLPEPIGELDAASLMICMRNYANTVLDLFGHPPLYLDNPPNPYPWFNPQLDKGNFFERDMGPVYSHKDAHDVLTAPPVVVLDDGDDDGDDGRAVKRARVGDGDEERAGVGE